MRMLVGKNQSTTENLEGTASRASLVADCPMRYGLLEAILPMGRWLWKGDCSTWNQQLIVPVTWYTIYVVKFRYALSDTHAKSFTFARTGKFKQNNSVQIVEKFLV